MRSVLKGLFSIDKHPVRGLVMPEWAMLCYALFTLALLLFMHTALQDPQSMLLLRLQAVAMTLALWAVYRMAPCRFTMLCRVVGQMLLLGNWYPETFEFNRSLPNLDHVFATWEQHLFGFQPALTFSQDCPWPWFSEVLTLGYVSYYPLITVLLLFYLFCRYEGFLRASFIVLASFFLAYVVFLFLPVAGPQFYYQVAGLDNIAQGIFPDIGTYFATHVGTIHSPGYEDGVFYKLLVIAHEAGERPTAAFPSSHVSVTTVLLCLAWESRSRRLFWAMLPFGVLMFFATFYIQAHYAIDAIAGLAAGVAAYAFAAVVYRLCRRP